jgi:hypothetical protein
VEEDCIVKCEPGALGPAVRARFAATPVKRYPLLHELASNDALGSRQGAKGAQEAWADRDSAGLITNYPV